MSNEPIAVTLGRFAVEHNYDHLPAEVRESVKSRVLDILGICVAATKLDTSAAAIAFARSQGSLDQAHGVGAGAGLPATMAAFVNGVLAHSLDYDDTHLPSVLHPSATVVPAALAAAEMTGAGGKETIAAIAVGLEVCVRAGMAGYDDEARNSTFFDHGQHATSICGALGGAVAAGMLMGFDAEGITNALGVVASMSSGIIEANRTGGTVKRMHCGWAANSALSACELVANGFTGPPTVLEGRFGFYEAWLHGQFEPRYLTEGLGEHWEVPGIFFKPYPANHFTHTAIDAAAAIRARGIAPDQIAFMRLGVAAPIVHTIGEPIEVKRRPTTPYMAQFSGPYAVVVGLLGGGGLGACLADYREELIVSPERTALMDRVEVVADDRCSAIFPEQFPSVLTVTLRDGTVVEEAVLANRGGTKRPLAYSEIAAKFRDNVAGLLKSDDCAQVEAHIGALEELDSLEPIFELLKGLEVE